MVEEGLFRFGGLERARLATPHLARQQDHDGASGQHRGAWQGNGGQAIDRSHGGLTTKLHALVLDDRLPLIASLTPGHWGDAPWGRWLLERLGPKLASRC